MAKKTLYENIYTPFATSSIRTNYKRLMALKEAEEDQTAAPQDAKSNNVEPQTAPKQDTSTTNQPKQGIGNCKVIMQILKNGKPIKKYCCPDEKLLPKHFSYVYKVLGKMENGKDDFKIVTHKEEETAQDTGVNEVSPKGWEKTIKGMKKNKDIDNPYALANWMKSKGYKHKK